MLPGLLRGSAEPRAELLHGYVLSLTRGGEYAVGCVTKGKLACVLLTHETVIEQALYHEIRDQLFDADTLTNC